MYEVYWRCITNRKDDENESNRRLRTVWEITSTMHMRVQWTRYQRRMQNVQEETRYQHGT